MKLSNYFTLDEFLRSETAMKKGFKEQYSPEIHIVQNLRLLAENIADPIRDYFGSFSPTVAYRCDRLNKAVGGAKNSEHLYGKAFDETFIRNGVNVSNQIADWLIYHSNLRWSKLILEMPFKEGNKINYRWLHVGYDISNLKNEILVAKKNAFGKTVYEIFKK